MCSETITELRKFVAPEFIFGIKARLQAGIYAKNLGISRVLLVSDAGIMNSGWVSGVQESLDKERVSSVIYHSVTPNPRSSEVMNGVEVYKQFGCDGILAVGGGSPIDCAKGIAIVVANNKHILRFEGVDTIPVPGPPLICIPTTAGAAADVSQFAIILNEEEKNKIAIISKAIVPDVSLIDPETTLTMDSYLTACTGLDSLTHAIEALCSNANSPITDLHASHAIKLIYSNIRKTMEFPDDLNLRSKMTQGCLEAGLAFSNASLGAVHAMAHSLGGFLDLPHGECNAILLSHVINFNFPDSQQQFHKIAELIGIQDKNLAGKSLRHKVVDKIMTLRHEVNVKRNLGDVGVRTVDIPELARKALNDPCIVTNPRNINLRDIEVIYEEAI